MNPKDASSMRDHLRSIARFWLPLAAMWLFMGLEMPIINAFIARLPEARDNLAAFGVVFSISILIESPIVQMLTTGTALANDRTHYRRLLFFMTVFGVVLTVLHLLVAFTPLFDLIVGDIMGIPEVIKDLSRLPFILFFPFAAAVGYRRLWQGVLIKYGKTKHVTVTMVVRFFFTTGILVAGYLWTDFSGALLGALALTGGVLSGAVAAWVFMRRVYRDMEERRESSAPLTLRNFIQFYIPLALTSVIIIGVRPVLAAGIARGRMPIESLATWPVIQGFLFLFRSIALSYQEVVVALADQPDKNPAVRRFTLYIAGGITAAFLITALTPLSDFWFRRITGLKEDLLPFTSLPFLLGAPVPVLSALISYYRGTLVHIRNTKKIAWAVSINSALVIVVLFAGVAIIPATGAVVAAAALSVSIIAETVFLHYGIPKMERKLC